jgi:hypothetical protein
VVATHLVDRIRAAVGRTAIGAPKTEGRGLTEDPNSVAEYLDNTLSSDQLEAFERICIESELHLAEVAACHGLLAELARDPTVQHGLHGDEGQRIQQRLRGLLAGLHDRAATEQAAMKPAGDDHRESRETAHAIRDAVAAATGVRSGHVASGNGVVDPHRLPARPAAGRSSFAAWAAAAVAVALLLTLAGVLAWSLLGGNLAGRAGGRSQEVASVEQQPVMAPPPPVPAVENVSPATAAPEAPAATMEDPPTQPAPTQPAQDAKPDQEAVNEAAPRPAVRQDAHSRCCVRNPESGARGHTCIADKQCYIEFVIDFVCQLRLLHPLPHHLIALPRHRCPHFDDYHLE